MPAAGWSEPDASARVWAVADASGSDSNSDNTYQLEDDGPAADSTNSHGRLPPADGPQVAFQRAVDGGVGVVADQRVPPGPVDAVIRERLDHTDKEAHGRGR